MKIKAIAPWFGGKRTLAPTVVEELGEHSAFWENFCGGISIIFAKRRSRQEVLNDLHGDLTNLAVVISSTRWEELHQRTERTLYSEGVFEGCKGAIVDDDFPFATSPEAVGPHHVNRAFYYLVMCWMGRNGAAGTARVNYQFTMRYTANGGDSATRWSNMSSSLPGWHDRLRGVVISRKCGIELAEKIEDASGVAIYCDPPYLKEGDRYKHAFTSGGGMFGDDHLRLAMALRKFRKARVVVSYYAHPRLAELYPGWTARSCTMNKALHVQNKRGSEKSDAPEVLLLNGPSLAGGGK